MIRAAVTALALALLAVPAAAETVSTRQGGDLYIAGSGSVPDLDAGRDLFAIGPSLSLRGGVAGDAHVAGFDIELEGGVSGDVYAFGGTLALRAPTQGDLTAAGFSVRTAPEATTGGNARLSGAALTIEGPVAGSLSAAGGEVTLNAPVTGDAWIVAETLDFGPAARIGGRLRYSAPEPLDIPEGVIAPERVEFTRMERPEIFDEVARGAWPREYPMMPSFLSMLAAALVTLAFLFVLGAVLLAFVPERVERLRAGAAARPGVALLLGVAGLSAAIGLAPVSALTVIGLPLLPFVLLGVVLLWTLGYVLGAYSVAFRFWQALGGQTEPGLGPRLVALAAGLGVMAMLNFIPVVGWIANFSLVLFGIGALTLALVTAIPRAKPEKAKS
jgi:hypothetical protein